MSDEIRVAIFGAAGEQGRLCAKYLTDRGVRVVAAVGRNRNVGEDIGELAGVGSLGVTIQGVADLDLAALLEETRPNVAIDCVGNVGEIYEYVRTCVEHGVNVIMMGKDTYYPAISEPELTAELDALARRHGVTLVGCGVQDVHFSNIPAVLTGNCIKLSSITIENVCILDHAGAGEWDGMGIDLTEEEFYELHGDDPSPRCPLAWGMYELADELGLHVVDELNHVMTPILATADYDKNKYAGVIHEGRVIGVHMDGELRTEEDIHIIGRFAYAFRQHHDDVFRWYVDGEPDLEAVLTGGNPGWSTAIDCVLRIPDVINAPVGFLTVKDLPKPAFKHGDLNKYVDWSASRGAEQVGAGAQG